MKIQVAVFWVVTSCSDVVGYQRFGGPSCLSHHYTSSQPRKLRLEQTKEPAIKCWPLIGCQPGLQVGGPHP